MNRIEQTYVIEASPEQVWEALTNPDLISQWSGSPAVFAAEPGSEYSIWDGQIGGSIVEVIPGERLVQTWKPTDWTVEDSVVTFTLSPSDSGTRVDLVHENVQDWDYDGTNEGWDIYYLGVIKKMLEEGGPAKKAAPARRAPAKKRAASKRASAGKKTSSKKSASKKKVASKKRASTKR
jgi:uncharacterized protein YndB with AHSA1/START domain